ncbi:MAG TPA: 2'-5' RNA ligase family protein [Acidimicrobiia bacterium]|nr:2'-5' RNA ligase family protein [Acidimicrobiia bacterium]
MTFEGDSALIVPVPEADPVIHPWRLQHDPAAVAGVPAHVTVLFPFVPRSQIGDASRDAVKQIADRTGSFEYLLAEIRWFGSDVVYLAPDPDVVFRGLTAAVWASFPQHPPYGGVHDDPTPHVTIGHAETGDLQPAIEAITRSLPIPATADRIELIEFADDRWRTTDSFPLRLSV